MSPIQATTASRSSTPPLVLTVTTWGSAGSGQSQFNCPQGVAVSPVNGDLYVADRCNNRVQVFSSTRVFKLQLGTGVSGSSNTQFASPVSVAIDTNGIVFVTDTDNDRIQKCTISGTSYACSLFAGIPGESGNDFSHLAWPHQIAVDGSGRVYLADSSNSRVLVFDATGALLTTIGGDWEWSSTPGQFMEPEGLALDNAGNLYVADTRNSRIEKFALGVPGWVQTNINGFGLAHASFSALEEFNGQLYAGASGFDGTGAQVFRSTDGRAWSAVSQPGFGVADPSVNGAIPDMQVFNGQIYASTGWGNGAGQLWRSSNGTDWEQVVDDGFGNSGTSLEAMTVFNGDLYVGTQNDTSGFSIWRSSSGDTGSWTEVVSDGFGDPNTEGITSFATFNGYLYAAHEAKSSGNARILRSSDGSTWNWASPAGLGDANNYQTGGFAIFNGYLYIGTRNDGTGGQVWRSDNGTTWTQIIGDGFGDINNFKIEALYPFGGNLYAGTDNSSTGAEIWCTSEGTTWQQVNLDGFGSSANVGTVWSSDVTAFNDQLYFATFNNGGTRIWQMLTKVFLPLVIK